MEFRRSGGRDERRRRVLMDESNATEQPATGSASKSTATSSSDSKPRNTPDYAEAAKAVRQVRLSDLVPRKAWLVAALTSFALLLGSGVIAAIWYAPTWPWLVESARPMLAPSTPGSLASWFASMLLLLCAAGAMQIYLLRRHKVNDYRGRYRLWVPVAVLLFLASADAVIGLHMLLGSALSTLLPTAWVPTSQLAWMIPFGIIVAVVGLRLAVETRRSYGTLTALMTCTAAYLTSAVVACRPEVMSLAGSTDAHAAATFSLATQLLGHVLLLLTVMLYGRYVFLAANDLMAVRPARTPRKARSKSKQVASEKAEATTSEATDEKPVATRKRKKKPAAKSPAKPATQEEPAKKTPEPKPAAAKASTSTTAPKASISKASNSSPPPAEQADSEPATLSIEELADQSDLTPADTAHLSKAERRRLRKLQKRANRAA